MKHALGKGRYGLVQLWDALHQSNHNYWPSPRSSGGTVEDLWKGSHLFKPPARPIFFPRIGDSHCDMIHSSRCHCFDDGYVGKQPIAWKEYCAEYWLKELQESIDMCTGRRDITEITFKTSLNTKSNNQGPYSPSILKGGYLDFSHLN